MLRFGFMSSYNVWTKHGEEGVMMEDGDEEEDNDDQYRSMFSECDDTAMEDNEEEGGEEQAADDPVDDDLRRAISDARRDCGMDKERLQFDKMLEDHHKLLYPAALAGVQIRAGLLTVDGERVVTALVDRVLGMDYINDNTGYFASGGKYPKKKHTVELGSFRVYYGTVPERQRLSPVLVAPDPPRSALSSGRAAGSVEVLVVGAGDAGKGAAAEAAATTKSTRTAKPPTERDQVAAGTSAAPPETPLQAAMSVLARPIAQNIDPAAAQAELEAQRQRLLENGKDIIRAQRELNLTLREYNAAHGFASVSAHQARQPENRLRGRNLEQDLRKEILTGKSASASVSIVEKPKYSSPDKTLKAARAAVELCESLIGDALVRQQDRVKELLDMIEVQNAEQQAKINKAVASKSLRSARNAGSKSHGQASSPHPDKRKEKTNAQQMTVYDPVLAGKQQAGVGKQQAGRYEAGRKNQGETHALAGNGNAAKEYAGREGSGQNFRAAKAAYVEEEMPPPRYRQARAAAPERYEEVDSGAERVVVYRNPLGGRLGERCLPDRDARHRLDRVYLSEIIEAEGPPGPKCFGPRIMKEGPPVRNFQLPRDTKTYDGTTKPEDWLADYVTAVYVAGGGGTVAGGGNRRWAESALTSFLCENRNIFAWSTDDLVGVVLAEHCLNVRKDAKTVRQPLRRFAEDRKKIIGEEVTKLLVAGFILEVLHTEWLANPVMVEKKKEENLEAKAPKVWRMCIDYTNLNKACPKDPFPAPDRSSD
ncbi:hypothetical protein QYE76_017989 [Lolium multiflorum]|uniref:Uncharacterized protein n=1 Tax=Lolium multiflorum TaxID=4521 RepID=A0AAD8QG84_LOLMU|nr:hypothetical protein QYE76_017989 [Lolium multiflorum]